jgi:heme-degrading monooxygenase HmoA
VYGVHVEFIIHPGLEGDFLEWKRREGELHARSPGFVKRSMTRDLEKPNVFYFVCFWETQDHHIAFTKDPEFDRALAETRVRDAIAERKVSLVEEVF